MGPACASHRVGQHESRTPLAGLECGVAKRSRGVETPDDEGEGIDVVGKAAIPWAGLLGAESKMNVGDAPSIAACASRAEDIASFDRLPLPDVDLRKMAIERPPQRGLLGPVLDADTVTTAPLKTSPDDDPVGRRDHRIPYEGSDIDTWVTSRRSRETVVRQESGRALWRAPEKHDRVEHRECRQRIPEELVGHRIFQGLRQYPLVSTPAYAYWMPMTSATSAGRSWPSTSITISEVRRTPLPGTSSTFLIVCLRRMREPAGTTFVKRILFEP